jgi:hypothetical protein
MRVPQAYYKYVASSLGHLALHCRAEMGGEQPPAINVPIEAGRPLLIRAQSRDTHRHAHRLNNY